MAAAYALAGDAATAQGPQPQAAAAAAAAAAAHGPALQHLLLRFLPFRAHKAVGSTAQQHQHNRHALLEELQRNPLWRFSSLNEQQQQQLQRNNLAKTLPQQAHDALLDYVRMAANAEQHQQQEHRQRGQRSPADAAAELHALYALAVVHVASQQQQPHHKGPGSAQGSCESSRHNSSLDDKEVLDLLRAYVSLDQAASSGDQQHGEQQQGSSGGEQQQAAAAAVHALYAFAQLADSVKQKQTAPGALQANRRLLEPAGGAGQPSKQQGNAPGRCGDSSSRVDGQHDLQVLLRLAQLSMQPQ